MASRSGRTRDNPHFMMMGVEGSEARMAYYVRFGAREAYCARQPRAAEPNMRCSLTVLLIKIVS